MSIDSHPYSVASPNRRKLLGAGLGLLASATAGCGNSPVAQTLGAVWGQRFGGDPFTPEQVASLPYATMAARIGNSARAMLVLGRVQGEDLHWISSDKGVLVTRHGRLVQSVGLAEDNLARTTMLDIDPLAPNGNWQTARRWRRTVDLQPGNRFGLIVDAEWTPVSEMAIQTFWGERRGVLVKEVCEIGKKTLINHFWFAPDSGEIIKSEQHIWPGVPQITLETLKPYVPPQLQG